MSAGGFPLIVRDADDKSIRRFCYVESAMGFMFYETVFAKRGVLTLTHQLGFTIATVTNRLGRFTVEIHHDAIFNFFKRRPSPV